MTDAPMNRRAPATAAARISVFALLLVVFVATASVSRAVSAAEEGHATEADHASQSAPGREHASGQEHAGAEEHGINAKTLALQLFNFGVMLFVLVKFGGGAINKSLLARHEQLKSAIEESAKLRAAAEQRLQAQEARVANLEGELTAMRTAMTNDAQTERTRLLAGAEDKTRRIQQETRFLLDQQVRAAELRFRQDVAEAALLVADQVLRKQVTPSDEQRLAKAFVASVATAAGRPD